MKTTDTPMTVRGLPNTAPAPVPPPGPRQRTRAATPKLETKDDLKKRLKAWEQFGDLLGNLRWELERAIPPRPEDIPPDPRVDWLEAEKLQVIGHPDLLDPIKALLGPVDRANRPRESTPRKSATAGKRGNLTRAIDCTDASRNDGLPAQSDPSAGFQSR
jgi:hypothetical protein